MDHPVTELPDNHIWQYGSGNQPARLNNSFRLHRLAGGGINTEHRAHG